ncbi:MAG: FtsX-like permease family protein [Rikenellaceae bacterium]
MKNILKNFWITLTRFKVASLLNVAGLSMAFALFVIICAQSNWEYGYNKSIAESDRIYSMYVYNESKYWSVSSVPLIDAAGQSNPRVEAYTYITNPYEKMVGVYGKDNEYIDVKSSYTSSSFIDVFDMKCLEGNLADYVQPNSTIIPISAKEKLFGNGQAIGEKIVVEDKEYAVVAVIEDFSSNTIFGESMMINNGAAVYGNSVGQWNYYSFFKFAPDHAESDFEISSKAVNELGTKSDTFIEEVAGKSRVLFEPITDYYFSENNPIGNLPLSNVMILVALLVVAIALVNYLNFFIALAPIRIKAVNINKVFGAPTLALRMNVIAEGVMFMLMSYMFTILIIHIVSGSFIAELLDADIGVKSNIYLLSLCFLGTAILGTAIALIPAFYITSFSPALVLKGAFGRSKTGKVTRQLLSVFQFVISFVIASGALFVIMQNRYLMDYDYGFQRENVVICEPTRAVMNKWEAFESELQKHPEISLAARSINYILLKGGASFSLSIGGEYCSFVPCFVDDKFVKVHDLEILEGRDFKYGGNKIEMIINQAMAKSYDLELGDNIGDDGDYEVVGIMKDFNIQSLYFPVKPTALVRLSKNSENFSKANIKLNDGVSYDTAKDIIISSMAEIDNSGQAESKYVSTLDNYISAVYSKEGKISRLISLFALVVFVISLMGIFGMILFDMQYRHREIALRKVYGSSVAQLLLKFNYQVLVTMAVSFIVSVPVTWFAIDGWLSTFAYRTPLYWWVFVVVALVLTVVVVAVVTIQCYSVAVANPIKSLRSN